ncbi:MAG: MBL fold metallo-hydrolase [bacterium]
MKRSVLLSLLGLFGAVAPSYGQSGYPPDLFPTSQGELRIDFVGHGSLYLSFAGKVIHVDPVSQYGDYTKLPKADLILVTHEHRDHLDLEAIKILCKQDTKILANKAVAAQISGAIAMENNDVKDFFGLKIEAIAAYNLVHMRSPGVPYHPKGQGNGYVITLGDKKLYVAGDTENTPEMKALKDIDIAFLPMNLPYTMTPEMVADAAKSFKPRILYPYHYGETDPQSLLELLKDTPQVEVRIRPMR